jgi:hypothetical protein
MTNPQLAAKRIGYTNDRFLSAEEKLKKDRRARQQVVHLKRKLATAQVVVALHGEEAAERRLAQRVRAAKRRR